MLAGGGLLVRRAKGINTAFLKRALVGRALLQTNTEAIEVDEIAGGMQQGLDVEELYAAFVRESRQQAFVRATDLIGGMEEHELEAGRFQNKKQKQK